MGKSFKRVLQIITTILALFVAVRFVMAVLERINPVSKNEYIEVYRDKFVD